MMRKRHCAIGKGNYTCALKIGNLLDSSFNRSTHPMHTPRIAILGFAIECNRFAPPSTRADFETRALLRGEALIDEARKDAPVLTPEIPAFVPRHGCTCSVGSGAAPFR